MLPPGEAKDLYDKLQDDIEASVGGKLGSKDIKEVLEDVLRKKIKTATYDALKGFSPLTIKDLIQHLEAK